MTQWDVVVAGAGPAGASAATILARLGYKVVLLDRCHFPRPKACAEYLSPGAIEALVSVGLDRAVLGEQSLAVPGMDIVTPSGTVMRLTYTGVDGALCARTMPRVALDAALVTGAVKHGAELWEGFTAHAALVEGGTVQGVRGSSGGKPVEVRAPLTVVADGARSAIARSLGLARPARWPVRLGLVAHFEGPASLDAGRGQMHVADEGYCGVAPLPKGRLNVSPVVRLDALQRSGCSAGEYLDRWVAEHPRLRDLLRSCRRVTRVRGISPVGARSVRAWAPGALLVGDAASFFDPFTGEGIYRAVVGATLAAQLADRALCSGNVSGASLSEYAVLRRRAFLAKEAVTRLVQLFVQYPRLLEYSVPRLQAREQARETLGLVLGDAEDAKRFLTPRMLWESLRP